MSVTFYPLTGEHDDRPDLNVCHVNAHALLDLLDLEHDDEYDLYGRMPAGEFQARVVLAQARIAVTGEDDGTPDIVEGRYVEFGRRPGYLADRLDALEAVAAWAAEHGGDVVWS